MDILSINAQIEEARNKRDILKKQKKDNEEKVKNGESILSGMSEYKKNSEGAINDFQEKLNSRCRNMPGTFGKYYKRQIQTALKKGNVYEFGNMVSAICAAIRNSVLDLDSVIEAIKSKIEGLNSLLKSLGDMLEDAKETIQDAFVGGDD